MDKFLKGEELYGDNFNQVEIENWYIEEKEASEELRKTYSSYDKLNRSNDYRNIFYGFRFLKNNIKNVLSIGGAYGDELFPLLKRVSGDVFIIESSQELIDKQKNQNKFKYLLAEKSGKINFEDSSFDVVTCFSTLHHIPNVSFVVREMYRTLRPGGFALISEPVVSMGDWNDPKTRKGLTKRERGIPEKIFDKIFSDTGFVVLKKNFCVFSPFHLLFGRILKGQPYNNKFIVLLDYLFSKIFSFNVKYYRRNIIDKISPSCIFYVLKKPVK